MSSGSLLENGSLPVGLVSDGEGGKTYVCVGDKVDLLPIHPEKPEGENRRFLSHREHESLRNFLEVAGPYEVTYIIFWPCGRFEICLKVEGRGPGARASNFRIVERAKC